MAWTNEQIDAITRRGTNIIVSAGAGSGKTAVLSERILEYCKSGNDIRRVLVLTFTSAAALEMKERIRNKLIENNLLQQADYIDCAYITTFDSYSLSLVKKYYYKLGLSKDISIMDQAMISLKRLEIINDLFNELYEKEDIEFLSYLSKYSKQSDKEVIEIIDKLCNKFELIIDFDKFVNDYENNYYSDDKLIEYVNDYEKLAINKVNNFIKILDEYLNIVATDLFSNKLYDQLLEFKNNLNSCNEYEDYYRYITAYSLPRVSPKADLRVKEEKENIKSELDDLKKNIFSKYIFKSEMLDELKSIKNDILFLIKLCKEVKDRLFIYKKGIMLFDYSDIAKFAIELVYNHKDVNDELKYYYNEILVDEYQDTSDIQEVFLNAISNNNIYMVGDIKQSIYRFRNANPYIFKEKYDNFSNNINGYKIDLKHNFRSRCEVLNNINLLFNSLMTSACGDADYISMHQMVYGQKMYEGLNQSVDFNIECLRYDSELLLDFSKEEKEAFICANEIKKIMDNRPHVLKGKEFVPVSYNDFAILIDKAKSFIVFKQIFEHLNIPLSIEADMDLKDSILPKIFANIISLMNKTRNNEYDKAYKHALASIARSFIYQYNDNDIYELLIKNKYLDILDDIKYLANQKEISYSNLFYEICFKLDIYDKLSYIGDVENSIEVLESIHNIFKSFESTNMDLNSISIYFNDLLDSKLDIKYKLQSSSKNSVRIMTIHKSKGLEFAYCLFPLLSSQFNTEDLKASIGFDSKYGLYIPFADEGKSNTIIKTLIADRISRADISEKVRLLYVALTRAREKMILILDNKEENINPNKFKSFKQMINYYNSYNGYIRDINLEEYNISKDYKLRKSEDLSTQNELLGYYRLDIKNMVANEYIFDIDDAIKNLEKVFIKRASKSLDSLPNKKIKENIELGLLFHSALEALDLANPNIDMLPVDDFVKERITNIFNNDIFKNIKNGKYYQEHEFYMNIDNEEYHGIIDLFVVYDDHIDLIDYKLSNVDDSEYIKQLDIYKKYIYSKWNKKINVYLLSILKSEIKQLEL